MQTTSDVAASMGKVVSMILFVIDKTYTSEQIVSDYHKSVPEKLCVHSNGILSTP